MLFIIAHHYVVQSGLASIITESPLQAQSWFLYFFGMWGKTGINCFVLITGYFMCKSGISLRKFLKLLLEVEFYKILIFVVFCFAGRTECNAANFLKTLMPFRDIDTGFIGGFLMYYISIPFLNTLIQHIDKSRHQLLAAYTLLLWTIMAKFGFQLTLNYVAWFSVLHIIASYIRLYGLTHNDDRRFWGVATLSSVILAMLSVVTIRLLAGGCYWMVSDSNAPLALLVGLSSFMYFKNLKIRYVPLLNVLAAGTFAVFLIHNNTLVRDWLWHDVFRNCGLWQSPYLIPHAICSVVAIFYVCSMIDLVRRKLIERPLLDASIHVILKCLPLKFKKVL